MENPSPNYSLDKSLNMTWYLQDLGLSANEIVECLETLLNNKDQYGYNNITMYGIIRLVWSLIKCGCRYSGNGEFTYPQRHFNTHHMGRILDVLLYPVDIWSRLH